jgi:hypothetical protein
MLRFVRLQFAAVALVAAAMVSLSVASAWAFSQQTVLPSGSSNSTFSDPDNQFTTGQGAHPLGQNGPVVQFGIQQGPSAAFGRFQGNSNNSSPPDPYSHPLGNGN